MSVLPPVAPATTRNRLLAALPADEYAHLAPRLARVSAELGTVLVEVERPVTDVYFPESLVASQVSLMADGTAIETVTIGREGFVGLPAFLGAGQMTGQIFTQVPGEALRMSVDAFQAALDELPSLTRALNRYTQALITHVAQSSACNRVHAMTERCARWLLHTHDRVQSATFPLTHQFLSQMLGVRRATVSEAMGTLQAAGAVRYHMGQVRVTDRTALEARACECYAIITREFERLVGPGDRAPIGPSPLAHVTVSVDGRTALGDGAPAPGADP